LLAAARREIRAVRIEPALFDYLLAIVRRTRDWPAIALGASPRASTSLMLVAKAHAARDGRDFLIPDDVKEAAIPVLRHRLVLRPEAELEGFDTDRVVTDILTVTALPK
jgi:MoxR-like ATPase